MSYLKMTMKEADAINELVESNRSAIGGVDDEAKNEIEVACRAIGWR